MPAARKDSVSHLCRSLASPWWLCRLPGSARLPCGIAPCCCVATEPCEEEDEPVPTCPCLSATPPGRSEGEAPAPRRLQALASSADSCGHSPLLMLSAVGEGCPCVEEAMTAARSADSCHSPLREPMPLGWTAAWPSREREGKLARPMLQLFSCSIRSSTGAFGWWLSVCRGNEPHDSRSVYSACGAPEPCPPGIPAPAASVVDALFTAAEEAPRSATPCAPPPG